MRRVLERWAETIWYGKSRWWLVLWPLSLIYRLAVAVRRGLYVRGWLPAYRASIPVIIVGNITAGGSGKTPLVLCLAELMMARGIRPGVLMRGYGREKRAQAPCLVTVDSKVADVGDEALMIFARLQIPVCVGADRRAGSRLLEARQVDVILCDDGLQHYALQRDLEIIVVDGEREFGNRQMIPAGPLREMPGRLAHADLVVTHADVEPLPPRSMRLRGATLNGVGHSQCQPLHRFAGAVVDAVAGTGNPGRFFAALRAAGLTVVEHRFPDHHNYRSEDLDFAGRRPLLMTEKDAIKCHTMDLDNAWYLRVDAELSSDIENDFFTALQPLLKHTAEILT